MSHRGRLYVNGETHKPSATFLSSALNHSILLEERLRQLMPWEEQGMAVGFVAKLSCSLQWGSRIIPYEASKHVDVCQSVFPLVAGRFCCSSVFIVGGIRHCHSRLLCD